VHGEPPERQVVGVVNWPARKRNIYPNSSLARKRNVTRTVPWPPVFFLLSSPCKPNSSTGLTRKP